MNADLGAIVALVGVLISVFAAGWMALARYSVSTTLDGIKSKQLELEAKETKSEAKIDVLFERLRLDEQQTVALQGKIPLLEVKHDALARDVTTLQETQVPRAEWERQMAHISNQLEEIKRYQRTQSPSPGRYQGSGESGPFTPPVPKATR